MMMQCASDRVGYAHLIQTHLGFRLSPSHTLEAPDTSAVIEKDTVPEITLTPLFRMKWMPLVLVRLVVTKADHEGSEQNLTYA